MDSILEFADILGLLVRELTIRYHYVLLFVNKDWYNAVIQQHLTDPKVLLDYTPLLFSNVKKTKMRATSPSLGLIRTSYYLYRDDNNLWTDKEWMWYYIYCFE